MKIGERIAAEMQRLEISEGELGRRSGVNQPTIHRIITGDSKSPRQENVEKIAKALGVTPEWLWRGEGPELQAEPAKQQPPQRHQNVELALQPSRSLRDYPVISWVIAGQRAESPENFSRQAPEEWLPSTENAGQDGYWLVVKGPSMTAPGSPSFPEGTRILVRPEGFDLVSGKFYVAKHRDGETTFKQYIYDGGREYLVPLNKEFKQVEMDDNWDVIGRVIDMKAPKGVL